jgi:hypothetical protein
VVSKKFSGEVMVDYGKIPIRNKKGRAEEWLVLGFIERSSNRCRGYLVPNIKQQTIC